MSNEHLKKQAERADRLDAVGNSMIIKWGNQKKEQRTELRGLVSVPPGGLKRSAEIHIVGYGGRSYMYEMTLPGGRYLKRVGICSLAEAREESESVARMLLGVFADKFDAARIR